MLAVLVEGLRTRQNGRRHCALQWSSKNGQQGMQEAKTAAPIKDDGRATVRETATYFRIRPSAVKEATLLQHNLCCR